MKIIMLLSLICFGAFAQEKNYISEEVAVDTEISGTLLVPKGVKHPPLAILIAGSGPTDRDGNNPQLKNNSLKYLAEGLAEKGIAVYRYDKRFLSQIKKGALQEEKLSFDDGVKDASLVVAFFKSDPKYKKLFLIGHSEGALIALLAAQQSSAVTKVVSLAGVGSNSAFLIKEQIAKNAPQLTPATERILDKLQKGETTDEIPVALQAVFRKSVQPYLISWFKYEPTKEIAKLKVPVLIAQGTRDLQVESKEAISLKEAYPKAQLLMIENMNHLLKEVNNDSENQQSYYDPSFPVSQKLIEGIAQFLL